MAAVGAFKHALIQSNAIALKMSRVLVLIANDRNQLNSEQLNRIRIS